jgi:hypothetical protein
MDLTEETVMRKLIIALSAIGFTLSVPLAAAVKAEDTTVIRKDDGDTSSKTVIKKEEPFANKKVIIKKHSEYEHD